MDGEKERGRGRNDDESEDEEYEVEGLTDSTKLSWKGFFKLLQYGEGQEDQSTRKGGVGREEDTSIFATSPSHPFVILPRNGWYLLWNQFILIWAVYSSFFTPFEFGFFRGLPENLFLLDIAGQIAFLIDIAVHFFVAYRDPHSYLMVNNRKSIALRYLKSRFLVDFLGCLPWDAIYKACGHKEPVRYLLWIRLSRVHRVTEFFEKMEKNTRINYLFTRIVKLLVVELYCTHTAACIFYYLATTLPPSKEGYTWIGSLKMGDYSYSHFRDIDLWKRYITSLYFAIVTMATVGYGEIHAVNIKEMIFIMIYVSFDMILGAYLLGNMTALIVKGSKTEKFRDKMTDLIKYMNRNKLGKKLCKEIKDHVRFQYQSGYIEASVLQDIPLSIRTKIARKLYEPFIKKVSLFKGCSSGFFKQIAMKVHEELFLPGEVIIEEGEGVDQLYFVWHGELEMMIMGEDAELEKSVTHFHTYSSFGEVSLLCNMPQPYTVRAREFCKLLRLDKESFINILEIYFCDGRIILNNLLVGKASNLQKRLLESDVTVYIGKHESELAMRVNFAAYSGDLYRLEHLVEAGADPNKTDYDGRSPLHLAASKGYEDVTLFLIKHGVNINITDNFGKTPLLEAMTNGHYEVATLLFNAGASLTIDEPGNCLCITVARRDSHFLERVLAYGINPNAKNYDYRTPLHIAASEGLHSMANLLLEAGASVLSKDRWGNTPLDEARIGGNKNLINLLEGARTAQLSEFYGSQGLRGQYESVLVGCNLQSGYSSEDESDHEPTSHTQQSTSLLYDTMKSFRWIKWVVFVVVYFFLRLKTIFY